MYLGKCHKVLNCICLMIRTKKNQMKKKKEQLISSLNEDNFYEIDGADYDEIKEVEMTDFERSQMKHSLRDSHHFFEEGRHEHERGGTSS